MKGQEIRQMTVEELKRKEGEMQKELFMYRIQRFTENTPDTSKTRKMKRDIARIRTILHEIETGKNAPLYQVRSKEE